MFGDGRQLRTREPHGARDASERARAYDHGALLVRKRKPKRTRSVDFVFLGKEAGGCHMSTECVACTCPRRESERSAKSGGHKTKKIHENRKSLEANEKTTSPLVVAGEVFIETRCARAVRATA